jgi:hypothetical protein
MIYLEYAGEITISIITIWLVIWCTEELLHPLDLNDKK